MMRTPAGYGFVVLLTLLLLTAASCPRKPAELSATEATHLAAALSLVQDRDWRFGDADKDRLGPQSRSSDSLLLRPAGSSEEQAFDVPGIYPAILAPVVWLAPIRGPAVVNAVLLALAATAAATRLGRRLGREGFAVISVCLFASVLYRSVFLISPTILMAACVALAFALLFRHEEPAIHSTREIYRPPETIAGAGALGFGAGALLGLVAIHHPLFLLLLIPAAVAIPSERRRSGLLGLLAGLVAVVAVFGRLGGLWGVPVDQMATGVRNPFSEISVGLTAWNLLYFGAGRNVGLLPYFLPALALLGVWQGGTGRSVLAATAIVGSLLFVVLTPFDFFGGPAAVGNASLVPWFVLLWFVPTRPLPRGWLVATVLLAVPCMYPTWLAPSVEPVTSEGVYRHSAGRFHYLLPVETTQQFLPPGEAMGSRFWIRSLSLEAQTSGSTRWLLAGENWAEMQLATPTELAAVHLQFGPQAETQLEVRGADLGDMVLLPDGGVGFRLENLKRRRLHPMWWSRERHFNYVLQFRMPMPEAGAQSLTLTAIAADLERTQP